MVIYHTVDIEKKAIAEMASRKTPKDYKPSRMSTGFYSVIKSLALNPLLLDLFRADPKKFVNSKNLTYSEKLALLSGHSGKNQDENETHFFRYGKAICSKYNT